MDELVCRSLSPEEEEEREEEEGGESDPLLERGSLEKAVETGSYYEINQITEMVQAMVFLGVFSSAIFFLVSPSDKIIQCC